MGLAASQARFLCITARKADCEYRSTELAQQKLDITKQLSDISNQYAQAMNATKLVWSHEGLAADCTMNYGLMMLPSAANDFNPYMITSPSGAIVLNTAYAAAARAAGISKAGGVGSEASRNDFIKSLTEQGLITENTYSAVTKIDWNKHAGMGSEPLNKGNASVTTLADLTLSESIGQKIVDWTVLALTPNGNTITALQYATEKERLHKLKATVNSSYPITQDVINELTRIYKEVQDKGKDYQIKDNVTGADIKTYTAKELEDIVANANNYVSLDEESQDSLKVAVKQIIEQRYRDLIGKSVATTGSSGDILDIKDAINLDSASVNSNYKYYSVVQNGLINNDAVELKDITIGDILNQNIVLICNADYNNEEHQQEFFNDIRLLFDSLVESFGYSPNKDLFGSGLNVDDTSREALEFAYTMINEIFLNESDRVINTHTSASATSMTDNRQYLDAISTNRVATGENFTSVSLTNMLSSFLTYYENYLTGVGSPYVVGKHLTTTYYVTDDPAYQYVMQVTDDVETSVAVKSADFYDQLYNNILEHGWREDSAIDDSEYLESMLKDGRYSMSSLNQDGYYYQTRYNETGYIVEVSDTDAIERAEAEFISMKAQLTFKEDSIDIKTKKLDAEISALSTEYETVKGLISKCIEKTFAMFSN